MGSTTNIIFSGQEPEHKPGQLLSLGRNQLFSGGAAPERMGRPSGGPAPSYEPKQKPVAEPKDQPKLDPVQSAYEKYAQHPHPKHLDAVLNAAEPTISKALISYGGGDGALMRGRARLIAADAVTSYNPKSGAKLNSWLMTNLQSLQRYRQQLSPISTPERVALDSGLLEKSRQELIQETGREPSTQELSDRSGLSSKRMRHLQKFTSGMVPESALRDDEGEQWLPGVPDNHPDAMWAELVYHDLDPKNKVIYDMLLGRGQHAGQKYSTTEIAKKLNMSSAAVSQRSGKIAQMLEQGDQLGITSGNN